jgi:pimeloyl-ACP methyl ester carboxylesterase
MRYDPAVEIAKLTCPVLIISGDKDLQVKETDYDALRGAVPAARAVRIEGMSHTLKITDSDNMQVQLYSVYMNPAIPLSDELVMEIKNFVK